MTATMVLAGGGLVTTSLSGRQWVVVVALSLIAPALVGVDKAIQLRRRGVPRMGAGA